MNKHIAKIVIINSLLFGCAIGMNRERRNPEWRCSEHTESKAELIGMGMAELAMCGYIAYIELKDTAPVKYIFGNYQDTNHLAATVAGGTEAQRLAMIESDHNTSICTYKRLATSTLLLTDVGYRLWKIRHYEEYLRRRHAIHNCLNNHQ